MKGWEMLLGLVGIAVGLLPYVMSPEGLRGWALTRDTRGRRKKLAQLEARKVFLTTLHGSAAEQAQYLMQGVLIVLAAIAAAVVLGVQTWVRWPRGSVAIAWTCAWGVYVFTLYRLGVHRRARKARLFKKAMGQIDEQLAVLQVIEDCRARRELERNG